jgi:hypothetical protein
MTAGVITADHLKLFAILPDVGDGSCFLTIEGKLNFPGFKIP